QEVEGSGFIGICVVHENIVVVLPGGEEGERPAEAHIRRSGERMLGSTRQAVAVVRLIGLCELVVPEMVERPRSAEPQEMRRQPGGCNFCTLLYGSPCVHEVIRSGS